MTPTHPVLASRRTGSVMSTISTCYQRVEHLVHEMAAFAAVGAAAFVLDTALFSYLRDPVGMGLVQASVLGNAAGAVITYLGNRHWTYRRRGAQGGRGRELALFVLVNLVGMALQSGVGVASHDLLGLHGLVADNVARSGVGMALAMVFRFWCYRTLVFPPGGRAARRPARDTPVTTTSAAASGACPAGARALVSAGSGRNNSATRQGKGCPVGEKEQIASSGDEQTRRKSTVKMLSSLYRRFQHLLHEVGKFGMVGLGALVVNAVAFNLLRGDSHDAQPLRATIIASIAATAFAYLGNRYWTYRDRANTGMGREYLLFFVINGIAAAIQFACVAVSHYLLGFESKLADNVSNYVFGLALGTLFRFWTYRTWVFPTVGEEELPELEPRTAEAEAVAARVDG